MPLYNLKENRTNFENEIRPTENIILNRNGLNFEEELDITFFETYKNMKIIGKIQVKSGSILPEASIGEAYRIENNGRIGSYTVQMHDVMLCVKTSPESLNNKYDKNWIKLSNSYKSSSGSVTSVGFKWLPLIGGEDITSGFIWLPLVGDL